MGSPRSGRELRAAQLLRVPEGIPKLLRMAALWGMWAQVPQDRMAVGHPGRRMHEQ